LKKVEGKMASTASYFEEICQNEKHFLINHPINLVLIINHELW
jgi:hypothetical protein